MIRLKTFDEMLEVVLTSEEKNERAAKMSATVIERRRLKEEAKRQSESFNSKIKLLDQEIEAEAVVIENGLEWRKVQCAERISETGIEVEIIRSDNGDVVRTRAMTEEERQEELFPEPPPPVDGDAERDTDMSENMANAAAFFDQNNETAEGEVCACGHKISRWKENGHQFKDCNEKGCVCDDCGTIQQYLRAPLERCEECGRIEGAHAPQCAHASKFTYNTYLEFAKAQKMKNPASHARKMELSRERDDEVRAWLELQQGAPADGELFNAKPELKPKRRGKLQLHSEGSYAEGL